MALTFNLLLKDAGVDPADVRLLRHETRRHRGQTPFSVWRSDVAAFDRYQSTQGRESRAWFRGAHWAAFVVTPDADTLFVGLYDIAGVEPVPPGWTHALDDRELDPDVTDLYALSSSGLMAEHRGRLVIDWGPGTRSWRQLAANQDKPIVELRRALVDPPFPGFAIFTAQLSDLETLPPGWRAALSAVHGVYLLTCPRTREQYVGSATGGDGFLGRWLGYVDDGHGGNAGLRSREPADYRVGILQVAGSGDDREAVVAMEANWKAKLQSREMGLNRN